MLLVRGATFPFPFAPFTFLLVRLSLFSYPPVTFAQSLYDVSIPMISPQIVYTPFLCNASTLSQTCNGAWELTNQTGTLLVSTTGPDPTSTNIIPQLFFSFRASMIHLTTSSLSNATVNVTVSTDDIVLSRLFDSAVGFFTVSKLLESITTTLTLSYIPGPSPTRLDISSLVLSVVNVSATTSFFPTPSLPLSVPAPTFISLSTTIPAPSPSLQTTPGKRTMIAEAVGLTVGLGLGLTMFSVIAMYLWRRRPLRYP